MDAAAWDKRMEQLLGLVERLVSAQVVQQAQPITVNVNTGEQPKKKPDGKAISDADNDGAEAVEPGRRQPYPYPS